MRRVTFAAGVAVVILIVLPVADAPAVAPRAIPAPNGVITGCYNNTTGALKVIDASSASCDAAAETQLTWNQQGQQGQPGPQGTPGAAAAGVRYLHYPWHLMFTDLSQPPGEYYIRHYATSTMVLPSAGTWVVHANVRPLGTANVDQCYLAISDGIVLPNDANPHFGDYLYVDDDYRFWDGGRTLVAHATTTKPSYAVLRCLPHGTPDTDGQLYGSDVYADFEAITVTQADDTDGSSVGSTPALPSAIASLAPGGASSGTLARTISGSTQSSLLRIAGGAKLTPSLRARIVLLAANGSTPAQIAAQTLATPKQITAVIRAYNLHGLASLR